MDIRTRIITACREMSASRGLHNFTMDELSKQTGVSKRTIYRYFRSKDEILDATLDCFINEVSAETDRILDIESDPTRLVKHMLNYLFIHGRFFVNPQGLNDLRQHYPHLWQKIDRIRAEKINRIFAVLTHRNAELSRGIDPRIISAVIIASIQAVLNPDFILENGLTFEETAEQLSSLLISVLTQSSL